MTKKFLLFLTKDQKQPFDYGGNYRRVMESIGGNSGNNVFQYSLQTILRKNNIGIETDIWSLSPVSDGRIEQLNEKYAAAVVAPANVLSGYAVRNGCLKRMTEYIRRLRMPVHIVSLGAQSSYDFSFDFLSECRKEAAAFVAAVLDGGGKIGVRGNFTQEAVCKLGFAPEDCEVIGCPSIFINGGALQVKKRNCLLTNCGRYLTGRRFGGTRRLKNILRLIPSHFLWIRRSFTACCTSHWTWGAKN